MRKMLNVLRKFVFPFNFLRVRHEDNKYFYVILRALGAIALVSIDIFAISVSLRVLVAGMQSLLGILAGFYIASLAAVATFNKPSMDEKMLGKPPVLPEGRFGVKETVELTRREYLCLLFGYLAATSVLMYVVTVAISSLSLSAETYSEEGVYIYQILRSLFMAAYAFVTFNLLSVTLLGVYFLSHGIHRESYRPRRPGGESG